MICVLLAEDERMVREALAVVLSLEPDIAVVAEVGRGDEVVEAALRTAPDVVVPDIEIPAGTASAWPRRLAHACPRAAC